MKPANDELQLPSGWALRAGAGGWMAVNKGKLWSTAVYCDKDGVGGEERAASAALALEEKATAVLNERERQCEALRKALRNE